jgi:hypothetical protein
VVVFSAGCMVLVGWCVASVVWSFFWWGVMGGGGLVWLWCGVLGLFWCVGVGVFVVLGVCSVGVVLFGCGWFVGLVCVVVGCCGFLVG